LVVAALAVVFVGLRATVISAQQAAPAGAADDDVLKIAHSIVTQVVTLRMQDQKGEPRVTSATASFDRRVLAYWIAVVGADVKYTKNSEHQFNRALFSVDPYAKVINGKDLEIAGKFGVRDGSGDWDDPYEGTITVAVTAVLADR